MLCLDSNVIIGILNGRKPILRRRFEEERIAESRLALSVVALFELRYGAANSERPEQHRRALEELLEAGIEILNFDADDAAGLIRNHCGIKSRSELATNDNAAKTWRALDDEFFRWQRGFR